MKRHNYKNLIIWKIGIDIADDVFRITNKFPKEEKFGFGHNGIRLVFK